MCVFRRPGCNNVDMDGLRPTEDNSKQTTEFFVKLPNLCKSDHLKLGPKHDAVENVLKLFVHLEYSAI